MNAQLTHFLVHTIGRETVFGTGVEVEEEELDRVLRGVV